MGAPEEGGAQTGVSARAEGESRVLGGAECDQESGGEQHMYGSSPEETISAQTQIIQGGKKKSEQDEPGSEWIAEAIRKTLL